METKPIFDFILEIQNRNQYVFPKDFSDNRAKTRSRWDYLKLLSKMEEEYEACVFQCVAENPKFKEELHVIADKIGSMVYDWKRKQSIKKLGKSPYGDSKRVAIQVGEKSLLFLQENYGVVVNTTESDVAVAVPKKKEERIITSTDSLIVDTIDGLAKFLGCSKSMAFSITDSGILMKEGIQYKVGKRWKYNRAKLEQYITEHPELLAKIRCKK